MPDEYLTSAQVARKTGASDRQLDYWIDAGLISPALKRHSRQMERARSGGSSTDRRTAVTKRRAAAHQDPAAFPDAFCWGWEIDSSPLPASPIPTVRVALCRPSQADRGGK